MNPRPPRASRVQESRPDGLGPDTLGTMSQAAGTRGLTNGVKREPIEVHARSPNKSDQRVEFCGKRLLMLGVGGCGMSGLARMLARMGASVRGVDSLTGDITDALESDGIQVIPDLPEMELDDEVDLVISSAAIRPEHPLLIEATNRGIPTLSYAEALGELTRCSTAVAIAGTHGKSTATAMLGATLVDCGLDPSVIVGATCPQLVHGSLGSPVFASPAGHRVGATSVPSGVFEGEPGLLLAEACEFNRSFHNLRPRVAAITSVEADHLDVYGSMEQVVEAFHEFAKLVPDAREGGTLLIAHEGAHRREVCGGIRCKVETIGFSPEADWVIVFDPHTQVTRLSRHGLQVASWAMRMPGQHNAMNAAFCCAIAMMLGADPERIGRSLTAFRGLDRRVQLLGERPDPTGGSIRVYDDYGHHPTAVEATLRALREFERPQDHGGKLVCVFQPHQHSRTRFLLEEFASAFGQADVVIVPHIYFVRDSIMEQHRVTAGDLVDRLRERGVRAMHLYPFEAIVEQLENVCQGGDLLVVMGAGPVWQVGHGYLRAGWSQEADAASG